MINVSIVLYKNTVSEISDLIDALKKSEIVSKIFLLDNSPAETAEFQQFGVNYIFIGKNLGYGVAHNIALRKSLEQNVDYHLVVNPDILLNKKALAQIENFMNKNAEIGQIMPKIFYPDGKIQYLCKLIPSPFDLFVRRFLPASFTKKSSARFEMRTSGYDKIMDVPYLSGCFMFLRISALRKIGLFDERFFMYPEDIDLTRRMNREFRTVFYPEVSVVHNHARQSYVNCKMLMIHIINIIRYFNKWGWFFDNERKIVNNQIISKLV
ncbi:MAG: glycosyltransferase [Paludibacter sp.]|jgi:GT2 family glycosyltransferase|nr:glycosyltransferase [Paludibacter sp.]